MEFPDNWARDVHDMLTFDEDAQIAERTQQVRSPEGAKLHALIDSLEELIYLEATQ